MKTSKVKNRGEESFGTLPEDFEERIKRAQEKSGILDQIKDVRGGVLSQFVSKDPFGIRKDTGGQHLDFAARIEESRRVNKIREKIGKIPENGVLRAADDFFGIKGDDEENVIDVEFEVM